MAKHSGLELTPQQINLYIALRGGELGDEMLSDTTLSLKSLPAGRMGDQQLLAEILRVTDEVFLDTFMNSYPHIFCAQIK